MQGRGGAGMAELAGEGLQGMVAVLAWPGWTWQPGMGQGGAGRF